MFVTPTYLLYSPDGLFVGVHTGPIELSVLEQVIGVTPGEFAQ